MAVSRRRFALGAAAAWRAVAAPPRPRPKLLLWIVLGQLRSAELFRNERAFTSGGFRRLIDEGAFFPECRHESATFPATGLANLATGSWPQTHGIVAGRWSANAASIAGRITEASTDALLAPSLIEEAARHPRTRLLVIGASDWTARLLAGRAQADLYAPGAGGVFTPVLAGRPAPSWLPAFQQAYAPERFRGAQWIALGAAAGARPLRVLHSGDFESLYRASPFAQTAQLDLMREWIVRERLGQGDATDVAVLHLDATEQLGLETGGDSPLMQQLVLHLDRGLESLIDAATKAVGALNLAIVLSAAHGAGPEPRRRVDGETVAQRVQQGLAARFDFAGVRNSYVAQYLFPFLRLRHDVLARYDIPLREARRAAGEAALAVDGVAGYYTADGDCSHGEPWLRRFQNSFHALRSGDLMLAYAPETVEAFAGARGVSYGSFYNYDAVTPLILHGGAFTAGRFDSAVEAIDVAPTLARVLGIPAPAAATGRVLAEALAEAA